MFIVWMLKQMKFGQRNIQKYEENFKLNYLFILLKVKAVVSKLDELVKKLSTDQTKREKSDVSVGIDIYKRESSHTSLKSENSSFMWFQLFVEVLLRMSHSSASITELIQLCRQGNYENSIFIIDEFEKNIFI